MSRRAALTLLLTALLTAATTTSALAAKGGGGGTSGSATSAIALTGDPSFGATASFAVTYQTMKWVPEMSVSCSISGKVVYLVAQTPGGSGPWTPQFLLWSQSWANSGGGPANCTATLYYYTWQGRAETGIVYLAETTFVAN
jgi:hypothetical protein